MSEFYCKNCSYIKGCNVLFDDTCSKCSCSVEIHDVQYLLQQQSKITTLEQQLAKITEASRWIPCTDWKQIPEGDWLVKIDKENKPYHVASVERNIIVVGNYFHWDMGNVIAYRQFDPVNLLLEVSE